MGLKSLVIAIALALLSMCSLGNLKLFAQPEPWARFSKNETEQRWYHQQFSQAFARVITDKSQLSKLAGSLKLGPVGSVDRDQVLDDFDILSFEQFMSRIHIRMEYFRKRWNNLEDQKRTGQATGQDVARALHDYLDSKLSVDEFVVVYDLYRQIGRAPKSFFSKARPLHRVDVVLALKVKSTVSWPLVPRRKHDQSLPKLPLDVKAWAQIYGDFEKMKMIPLLEELWSQWVNPQAGSSTTRHIIGFEDAFIFHCQQLSKSDPFRAVGLLQAYLISRVGSVTILSGRDPKGSGSASLLLYLNSLRNRDQLRKFFKGIWPERLGFDGDDKKLSGVPAILKRVLSDGPAGERFYPKAAADITALSQKCDPKTRAE
jgi:hypothetical protein